jgi:hypothetical protein
MMLDFRPEVGLLLPAVLLNDALGDDPRVV